MQTAVVFFMATFRAPQEIGTNPQSILWLVPLAAMIAIAYKATKLPAIKMRNFIKEAVVLFASIIIFIIIAASVLCTLAWLIT